MSDSSNLEIMAALATQLETQLALSYPGIQVVPLMEVNPTPPCVDIYPGDPFAEEVTFDSGEELLYTIRARVTTADREAGQELLLGLMDRDGGSVRGAVYTDRTLGGTADSVAVEGPSGYISYPDLSGTGAAGSLLGCEWRLRVLV
jgi:hypothetical protein